MKFLLIALVILIYLAAPLASRWQHDEACKPDPKAGKPEENNR